MFIVDFVATERDEPVVFVVDSGCRQGEEACKLAASHNSSSYNSSNNTRGSIQGLTVSTLINTLIKEQRLVVSEVDALPYIDILQIDSEGSDALIIRGAKGLLAQQRIRLLRFEYHEVPPWNTLLLKDTIADLHAMQYACYFEGQGRLWPISGTCWNDRYEFHQWSNVACFAVRDSWLQAMASFVVT